jgi:hypothetical protein
MKLIITTTYDSERMTVKEMLEQGEGMFCEDKDDCPSFIVACVEWLQAQNQRKKMLYLTNREETAVLK